VLTVAGVTSAVAVMLRAANGTVFPFLSLALIYGSMMVALLAIGADKLRLLESRAFYRVSRLSYGMYLNHFAVLRWIAPSVGRAVKAVGGQNPATLFVTLGLVIAISLSFAMATFVLIEHPFLALRERVQYTKSKVRGLPPTYAPVLAPAGGYSFGQLDGAVREPAYGSNDSARAARGNPSAEGLRD
jgi:peptidoglycan/LPS O-acetylase OafA/YrhL